MNATQIFASIAKAIAVVFFAFNSRAEQAVTNKTVASEAVNVGTNAPPAPDPVEIESRRLAAIAVVALAEIERWIGGPQPGGGAALRKRIDDRVAAVRAEFEKFLEKNPRHAQTRIDFGNFLNESGDESAANAQWEQALQIDPKNAEVWNNLANCYGHRGPVKKAFEYYARAVELAPRETVYLQNFATTVFLFRKDAREFYGISEEEVFDRAIQLYRRAIDLEPENYDLALDVAQSYYSIRPARSPEAVAAWSHALRIARTEVQRENAHIHLARFKMREGLFDEARRHLTSVTNEFNVAVRDRVLRDLESREKKAGLTGKTSLPVPIN
jgi:Tfp pilus assembly protein PilF